MQGIFSLPGAGDIVVVGGGTEIVDIDRLQ